MPSLGEEFRAAREARGLSLSDVAEHIHIRAAYLQAIEEEDWPAIGAPVYVRGFLRTYARFLGMDPERAVEAFNSVIPSVPPTRLAGPVIGVPRSGRAPSIGVWLGTAVALALLAYVSYGFYQLRHGTPVAVASPIVSPTAVAAESPSASPAAGAQPAALASASAGAEPSVAASATAEPTVASTPSEAALASAAPAESAAPAPHPSRPVVSLRVTQPSWLRVAVDGNVVLQGTFPAGTARSFGGKHVHVWVGNAAGVEIASPGHPAKVLGDAGEVVERDYKLAAEPAPTSTPE